jgi:hypothetical protein
MSLELAQDLREAKDWLARHKRDSFLWLAILGPLALAAITLWGPFVFPPSDAIRAIRQVLPKADVVLQQRQNFPSCRAKKYVFGYDFRFSTDGGRHESGRICRGVANGGWVLAIDNPRFKYLEFPYKQIGFVV